MTDTLKFETREAWLIGALEALAPLWGGEVDIPEIRVSVGFPGGSANRTQTIGQCWPGQATTDGITAIFVSPIIEDPIEVLCVLTHEVCHAILGAGFGHRKEFVALAKQAGLAGKWTSTHAGEELKPRLVEISEELGAWPHSALKPSALAALKQGTRMLKVACAEDGGEYKVRMTAKWLDEVGAPICPCHEVQMEVSA
jgi:hypothetical protein